MRDSYQILFSNGYILKEQLFAFGLSETIFVDFDTASREWENLKLKIKTNKPVFIRGFGRDANGTHLYQSFYKDIFGNEHITKDSTNNAEPTKLIREWTGYSKNRSGRFQPIRNYQISHVFGRTKNPYCFTAPWNIAYIPKIIDPLTGHEATGEFVNEYTKLFQRECYKKFNNLIDDFNNLVSTPQLLERIEISLNNMQHNENITQQQIEKLKKSIQCEFAKIEI